MPCLCLRSSFQPLTVTSQCTHSCHCLLCASSMTLTQGSPVGDCGTHRDWNGAQQNEQLKPCHPPRQPKVVAAGVLTDLVQGSCTCNEHSRHVPRQERKQKAKTQASVCCRSARNRGTGCFCLTQQRVMLQLFACDSLPDGPL